MRRTPALFAMLLFCLGSGCRHRSDLPVANTTGSLSDLRERVFTEADFNGFGLAAPALSNPQEFTFKVRINPKLPVYSFLVVPFTSGMQGHIDVFRGQNTAKPQQVIRLDPDMWLRDRVPTFFNVADINFDGYADIGVVVEGGAQWGSYEYWT